MDTHWDASSRRFSRDMWIIVAAFWAFAAVLLIVGLWAAVVEPLRIRVER